MKADSFRSVAFYNVPPAFGSFAGTAPFDPQPETRHGHVSPNASRPFTFEDLRKSPPILRAIPTSSQSPISPVPEPSWSCRC